MYLKRNDIEFLLFSRYLMMNSLLCLWKFNFYRNLCKDCFAPLSRQGLDKDSGRNRSIIKHKKVIIWALSLRFRNYMYYDDLLLLLLKSVTIQALRCCAAIRCLRCTPTRAAYLLFVLVPQWILWQRWTASGVAISTALTVWRETVRNSLE